MEYFEIFRENWVVLQSGTNSYYKKTNQYFLLNVRKYWQQQGIVALVIMIRGSNFYRLLEAFLPGFFFNVISEKNLKSNTFLLLKFDIIRNLCLNYSNFFLTDQLWE